MNKPVLAAVLILSGISLTASAARAQNTERYTPISGETLARLCTARDTLGPRQCEAYISGVSDAITSYQASRPESGSKGQPLESYICISGKPSGPQLRDAYVSWVKQHRDQLRFQASVAVIRALKDLFPCR